MNFQNQVANVTVMSYKILNTRAVPLVCKEDAHQGRVFFLSAWGRLERAGG